MPGEGTSSEAVNVEGEGGTYRAHARGEHGRARTRDGAHARRAADGFVRVDVAQSALRGARSPGTPACTGALRGYCG